MRVPVGTGWVLIEQYPDQMTVHWSSKLSAEEAAELAANLVHETAVAWVVQPDTGAKKIEARELADAASSGTVELLRFDQSDANRYQWRTVKHQPWTQFGWAGRIPDWEGLRGLVEQTATPEVIKDWDIARRQALEALERAKG